MPDIVIAGATFRGVPQIDIPKEGSGTASFVYEDGTKQITQNGTGIDVSGYAAVDVAVPSSQPVIQSLSIDQNGTYTAPSGVDGYSPVTVNVSGGGGFSVGTASVTFQSVTTSHTFTNLAGTPKAAYVRTKGQLTRSAGQMQYRIADVFWDGTNTRGNYHYQGGGSLSSTDAYVVSVNGNSLTVTGTAISSAPGAFWLGVEYELVYFY